MSEAIKWILCILAAIAIWPIVIFLLLNILWMIVTIGLIATMAIMIHRNIE
jgi:hypothetical protein